MILVTGGLGFIGHNVVRMLEDLHHGCVVLDSKTDYGVIPNYELNFVMEERQKLITAQAISMDIRDSSLIATFAKFEPDTIVHLASFPRQKIVLENPVLGADVMVSGLLRLLEVAKKFGVEKFVYISSSMVYGHFDNDVTELAPCYPQGAYAIMKYMGEKLVEDYCRKNKMAYVIIRPSAVYGERDVIDRVIAKFIVAALRDEVLTVRGPEEVLDFTYVEDIARGIVQATTNPNAFQVYNMTRSSPITTTLLDAARLIVDMVGSGKIDVQNKDANFPSRGRLSIARAKKELVYNPTTNIEEGFNKYVGWIRENRILWA